MMFRRLLAAVLACGVLGSASWALPAAAAAGAAARPTAAAVGSAEDDGDARMMLVLDSSGSMREPASGGQTKIEAAKSSLANVVESLPADAEVGLRVFGATVFSRTDAGSCTDSQRVVDIGSDNREDLLEAISSYKPYGETPIPHALQEAAKDLGSEGARSIVLVSDGESTCQPDPCKVAADLSRNGIDLAIDVVGLSVSGAAREQLQCIAEAGGGTYYDADSAADIQSKLNRAAQRSLRPFVLGGTPVEGGTADAPTPIGVGEWTDTLGKHGTPAGARYYAVEKTAAGTTLRTSAVFLGERSDEGFTLTLLDPSGEECDDGFVSRSWDTRALLGVQAVASAESDCDAPGTYTLSLERANAYGNDTALEYPTSLRVVEEPAVADPGPAPADDGAGVVQAPRVSGSAGEVVGGSSFATATELTSGRSHTGTIVQGETQMFRLPLQFGQSLRARAVFPRPAGSDEASGTVTMELYNPMLAQLEAPDDAITLRHYSNAEAEPLVTSTSPVNRQLTDHGGYLGVADFSMAGDYYIGVSLQSTDSSTSDEYPFTLDVEVAGAPGAGPTYAGGAEWDVASALATGAPGGGVAGPEPGEVSSPEGTVDTEDQQTAGATSDSSSGRLVSGLLAGLGGLVALGGALFFWRRRSTA